MKKDRRTFIKTATILSAGAVTGIPQAYSSIQQISAWAPLANGFELPPLGYSFDSLEPFIDAQTMQIHHDKHHQTYVTKLNEAVAKEPSLQGKSLEELVSNIGKMPESVKMAIRNHGGGHWNHSFFWTILKKDTKVSPKMETIIMDNFGSMDQFKKDFEKAATGVFGSGWAWVVKDDNNKLSIISSSNQDNTLMDIAAKKGKPILGIDVWEHAYYLKYQNKRADYVQAFWNVLNWNKVEELYHTK